MASEHLVFLNRQQVPSRTQWQTAVVAAGFELVIDEQFQPFSHCGYMPCRLMGMQTGVEAYCCAATAVLDDPAQLQVLAADRDYCIRFRWASSNESKCCAMILAYVLEKSFDGKSAYPGEAKVKSLDDKLQYIKSVLQDISQYRDHRMPAAAAAINSVEKAAFYGRSPDRQGAPSQRENKNRSKWRSPAIRSLLIGGILPVIAFAVVEELWGASAGLIAGMVLGVGEILWEWRTQKKVQAITWIGNGLLLSLGAISIVSDEGYWFKLQPAILEGAMAIALLASQAMGRPLLAAMAAKQLTLADVPLPAQTLVAARLRAMNGRLGVFFAVHTVLAVWSALAWSTAAWAMLKGIGFTASMIVYVGVEVLWARCKSKQHAV